MSKVSKSEKKMLLDVFKAKNKIDSFTLYKRSRLGFSDFTDTFKKLSDDGLVNEDDSERISLTNKGKEFVIKISSLGMNENQEWREVPDRFKDVSIDIHEPYIPNINLLDKNTFNIE